MGLLDGLLKKAANKIGSAVKQEAKKILKPAVQEAENKISDAAADAVANKIKDIIKPKEKEPAAAAAENAEAAGTDSFEEALAACREAGKAAAAGTSGQKIFWGEGGVDAYWDQLDAEWHADQEKNQGYVWTISIDQVTTLDAMGLAKMKYDLNLSCSHVGPEQNGVYRGSLAMAYGADLSGLTEMIGALGGRTSANRLSGWFRNDNFIMKLTPYNKAKEDAFLHGLDLIIDENFDVVEKPSENPYADAAAAPLLAQMGSGSEAFEKENEPESYWFDWDYHMTGGDIAHSYAISGVMGIAGSHGSIDESGSHVEAAGKAVTPFGVYTDRYEKDYESPFPYVIRVYGNRRVVFELHSPEGGPVVIKFYGRIDRIPVEQTIVAE